jgi:tRNA pseudouridine38-40 synthase
MYNFKLQIEYDGTHYHGWQAQDIKRTDYRANKTIQHVLEKAISKILQEDVKLTVAGRTDSGVHALGQVANFKSQAKMPLDKLRWAINGLLPEDIKVARIQKAGLHFNSRFSAKTKLYRYTVLNRKYSSPLLANRVYFFHYPLNVKLMRSEAKLLLGKHNFKVFQATDRQLKNPVRTIKSIKILKNKNFLYFDIQADSFLYNMIRSIVGTLLEIGRGRFPKGSMAKILGSKNRALAGPTLPAKGLCLVKVKY